MEQNSCRKPYSPCHTPCHTVPCPTAALRCCIQPQYCTCSRWKPAQLIVVPDNVLVQLCHVLSTMCRRAVGRAQSVRAALCKELPLRQCLPQPLDADLAVLLAGRARAPVLQAAGHPAPAGVPRRFCGHRCSSLAVLACHSMPCRTSSLLSIMQRFLVYSPPPPVSIPSKSDT